jgi:predicted nuclease of restriction endonuclease-like (RecB) superfamily
LHEANENNWGTRALQRQVNSLYYERLLSSQNKDLVKNEAVEKTKSLAAEDILKDPMVLEFLQLRDNKTYLESEFEQALLDHLSDFLLELGKGFAFVARQKRIRTETKEYAVDLVFYNYLLKCFVLIDLKTRELQHGDIGQIDMYVRYFEDKVKSTDDNPTIGIIMATEKDETVVKYSILNDSKNLFATKYKLYIPSIDELKEEIDKSKLNFNLMK